MPRARHQSKIETPAATPPRRARHQPKPDRLVPLFLDWFSRNARDLPWRRTRDPYAIWVSEIMLQQTQVKTALPYWERWMHELPTIESVARASPEKIHKLWEGLGYYTRVRNLQKAAQQLVATHGGRFPDTFDNVLALPGIGRYTAGAICSIAFNQPTPILDGNVIRVLTRVFGIEKNPKEKITNARLWELAEALVIHASRITHHASANSRTGLRPATARQARTKDENEKSRACSHLNQSLMELGALICTPREPACARCPIGGICVAHRENRVEELPNLGPRAVSTPRRFAAFVLRNQDRFLVRQRPAGVVNAHLWEFPNVELNGADLNEAARQTLGFAPSTLNPLCAIKHSITRYRITLDAFEAIGNHAAGPPVTAGRWLGFSELKKLSFPSAHKKILETLAADKLTGSL